MIKPDSLGDEMEMCAEGLALHKYEYGKRTLVGCLDCNAWGDENSSSLYMALPEADLRRALSLRADHELRGSKSAAERR
jgi:hypothetical protein